MSSMTTDPIKLFLNSLIAAFKISGYLAAAVIQGFWYLIHGRPDKIGDAIGSLGRGITDSIVDVFKEGK